jgi:hypothetical protein
LEVGQKPNAATPGIGGSVVACDHSCTEAGVRDHENHPKVQDGGSYSRQSVETGMCDVQPVEADSCDNSVTDDSGVMEMLIGFPVLAEL